MTPPRHQGRFVSPGTAQPAPLLVCPSERSRAAAVLGRLGGKATAAKARGRVLLVADLLRREAGLEPVVWRR